MPCTMEHRSSEFLQIKQRKINWHPRGCQFGFWTTLTLGAYDLKKEHVNIKERWFDVTAAKTEAGIRKVPISDKVLPFFEYWYNLNDCEYLLSTPEGKHFEYRNYYDSYWKPLIEQLGMSHRPHDTRHTCISLLAEARVDDRMVKKIVGHKG